MEGPQNNPIKLSVRGVTGLACARPAPPLPAAYRVRWADKKMERQVPRIVLIAILGLASTLAMAEGTPTIASAVYTYLAKQGHDERPPLHTFMADLNADGHADAVVILRGNAWCGSGGCKMLVFRGTEAGFIYVSGSTITNEPVMVLPEKVHGWHTLIVSTGGIGPVVMPFDGNRYPSNPSLQGKASSQQVKRAHALDKEVVGG